MAIPKAQSHANTEGWKRGTLAACEESQRAQDAVGWTCLWASVLALCPLKYYSSHVCPDNLVGMLHIALNILAYRPKPVKHGVRNRSRSSQSGSSSQKGLTPKAFTAHLPKSAGPGLPDCLQHRPGKCSVPVSEEAVTVCQMPTSWHAARLHREGGATDSYLELCNLPPLPVLPTPSQQKTGEQHATSHQKFSSKQFPTQHIYQWC